MNTNDSDRESLNTIPNPALLFGYTGVIPFIAAAAAVYAVPAWSEQALFALIAYGAVILSFLGGIRWGLAMNGDGSTTMGNLGLSVTPSLVGWAALFLPSRPGLLLLSGAFLAMCYLDARSARDGRVAAWYPRLRTPLSITAVASLMAGWVAA